MDAVRVSENSSQPDVAQEPAIPDSDGSGGLTPGSSLLNSLESSDEDENAELTKESILFARIHRQTQHRKLAGDLLDLHLRSRLSKPLLGFTDAMIHIFRLNAAPPISTKNLPSSFSQYHRTAQSSL